MFEILSRFWALYDHLEGFYKLFVLHISQRHHFLLYLVKHRVYWFPILFFWKCEEKTILRNFINLLTILIVCNMKHGSESYGTKIIYFCPKKQTKLVRISNNEHFDWIHNIFYFFCVKKRSITEKTVSHACSDMI